MDWLELDYDRWYAVILAMFLWAVAVARTVFYYLLRVGVAKTYSELPRSGLGVG